MHHALRISTPTDQRPRLRTLYTSKRTSEHDPQALSTQHACARPLLPPLPVDSIVRAAPVQYDDHLPSLSPRRPDLKLTHARALSCTYVSIRKPKGSTGQRQSYLPSRATYANQPGIAPRSGIDRSRTKRSHTPRAILISYITKPPIATHFCSPCISSRPVPHGSFWQLLCIPHVTPLRVFGRFGLP